MARREWPAGHAKTLGKPGTPAARLPAIVSPPDAPFRPFAIDITVEATSYPAMTTIPLSSGLY
ncbi:hypothetical protein ABTH93_20870, partial [Acinetobacter baumannii]